MLSNPAAGALLCVWLCVESISFPRRQKITFKQAMFIFLILQCGSLDEVNVPYYEVVKEKCESDIFSIEMGRPLYNSFCIFDLSGRQVFCFPDEKIISSSHVCIIKKPLSWTFATYSVKEATTGVPILLCDSFGFSVS